MRFCAVRQLVLIGWGSCSSGRVPRPPRRPCRRTSPERRRLGPARSTTPSTWPSSPSTARSRPPAARRPTWTRPGACSRPARATRPSSRLQWDQPVELAELIYWGRTTWFMNECWKDYEVYLDDAKSPAAKGTFQMIHGPQRVKIPQEQGLEGHLQVPQLLRRLQSRGPGDPGLRPQPHRQGVGPAGGPGQQRRWPSCRGSRRTTRSTSGTSSTSSRALHGPTLRPGGRASGPAGEARSRRPGPRPSRRERAGVRATRPTTAGQGRSRPGATPARRAPLRRRQAPGHPAARDQRLARLHVSLRGLPGRRRAVRRFAHATRAPSRAPGRLAHRADPRLRPLLRRHDGPVQLAQAAGRRLSPLDDQRRRHGPEAAHRRPVARLQRLLAARRRHRLPQHAHAAVRLLLARPGGHPAPDERRRLRACASSRPITSTTSRPCVLDDGRIIYTRWEYVDRPAIPIQSLWTINPDGTGPDGLLRQPRALAGHVHGGPLDPRQHEDHLHHDRPQRPDPRGDRRDRPLQGRQRPGGDRELTPDVPVPKVNEGCGNIDGTKLYSCPLPAGRDALPGLGPRPGPGADDLAASASRSPCRRRTTGCSTSRRSRSGRGPRPPVIPSTLARRERRPITPRSSCRTSTTAWSPTSQRGEVKTIRVVREMPKTRADRPQPAGLRVPVPGDLVRGDLCRQEGAGRRAGRARRLGLLPRAGRHADLLHGPGRPGPGRAADAELHAPHARRSAGLRRLPRAPPASLAAAAGRRRTRRRRRTCSRRNGASAASTTRGSSSPCSTSTASSATTPIDAAQADRPERRQDRLLQRLLRRAGPRKPGRARQPVRQLDPHLQRPGVEHPGDRAQDLGLAAKQAGRRGPLRPSGQGGQAAVQHGRDEPPPHPLLDRPERALLRHQRDGLSRAARLPADLARRTSKRCSPTWPRAAAPSATRAARSRAAGTTGCGSPSPSSTRSSWPRWPNRPAAARNAASRSSRQVTTRTTRRSSPPSTRSTAMLKRRPRMDMPGGQPAADVCRTCQ